MCVINDLFQRNRKFRRTYKFCVKKRKYKKSNPMKNMSAPPRVDSAESIRDQYEALRKLAMVQVGPPRNPNKPFTSFSISDILGGNNNNANRRHQAQRNLNNNNNVRSIVRPWDSRHSPGRDSECSSDEEEINVEDDEPSLPLLQNDSPLDALMKMANKTFEGLETAETAGRVQFALTGILSVVFLVLDLTNSEIFISDIVFIFKCLKNHEKQETSTVTTTSKK